MKEGSCVVRVGGRPGAAHVMANLRVREKNFERKRR
jgi:hypothetical protein